MSNLIDRDALGIGYKHHSAISNHAYIDGWNDAVEEIKNAPTVPAFGEWVNLNDRSPDENGVYLVYGYDMLNRGITFECDARYHCLNDDICKWDLGNRNGLYKVTHWMPLPETPKEEQDG